MINRCMFNDFFFFPGIYFIVNGMDTAKDELLLPIRKTAGMVFQNPDNQLIGNIVEEDIAVGSSKIIHSGSIESTSDIAIFCFCPPESAFGECSRYALIPVASNALVILSSISSLGIPIFS